MDETLKTPAKEQLTAKEKELKKRLDEVEIDDQLYNLSN